MERASDGDDGTHRTYKQCRLSGRDAACVWVPARGHESAYEVSPCGSKIRSKRSGKLLKINKSGKALLHLEGGKIAGWARVADLAPSAAASSDDVGDLEDVGSVSEPHAAAERCRRSSALIRATCTAFVICALTAVCLEAIGETKRQRGWVAEISAIATTVVDAAIPFWSYTTTAMGVVADRVARVARVAREAWEAWEARSAQVAV